ncbi:hypothetical protein EVAR_17716_1 [Eumeta japonica]|uniref:Uncharacterized protein n=1 Tax=Eumeta variegata TaxID=151549 RepID=A0A4C1URU6_EUMVA|nr:hypothetical protein EVAR_17716_1 [Eumeta japonica]
MPAESFSASGPPNGQHTTTCLHQRSSALVLVEWTKSPLCFFREFPRLRFRRTKKLFRFQAPPTRLQRRSFDRCPEKVNRMHLKQFFLYKQHASALTSSVRFLRSHCVQLDIAEVERLFRVATL